MSGIDPEDLVLPDKRLSLRRMLPAKRFDRPRWEVRFDDEVIGFIQEEQLHRATSLFYEALAYYPGTQDLISLELSSDFVNRCEVILAFHRDPGSSPHLPWQYRRRIEGPTSQREVNQAVRD